MGKEISWKGQDAALARMTPARRDEVRAMSPDEQLALLTHELSERKGLTRRAVVGGGLAILGTIYLASKGLINLDQRTRDQRAGKEKASGKDTPTHLEVLDEWKDFYPPKDGQPLPAESFITFGGLGCVDSQYHARPMAKNATGLPNETNTPMSFLVSSLEGKKIPEVADIIEQSAKESGSLSFYGQSNGSVVVLEALHYLKNRKENPKTIPVNRFVLNCSPFDFGDAKVNYIEQWLSKFLVDTSYTPGTIGQFLYLLRDNWSIDRENLFDSFLQSVQDSWDRAQEGEPPDPWIADLRILVRSRLNEHNFKGILTKNTKMLFLRSDNDEVVYNDPSIGKFQALAEKYETEFTVAPMPPGTRHADSVAGSKKAQPWIQRDRRTRGAVDN